MKVLALIPARGGSKGIKDKNIVDLAGRPLIAHSIDVGLQLKSRGLVERVVVSTDSEKIAAIAKEYGAEVPFFRPKEISQDHSKSAEAFLHAVEFFETKNEFFDAVLVLQPTAPLRTVEDLSQALKIFEKSKEDSLISCYREETVNLSHMYRSEKGRAIPMDPLHHLGARRQDHEAVYVRNGAIYITRVSYLKATQLTMSQEPLLYEMPKIRSANIDSMEDLIVARKLMAEK